MLHILQTNETPRPWWPAHQRWDVPKSKKIWCDCCNAYSPACEVDVQLMVEEFPVGGLGNYQEQWHHIGPDEKNQVGFQPSYYDPYWNVRCAEGFGCTIKPRRRASAHLRERL